MEEANVVAPLVIKNENKKSWNLYRLIGAVTTIVVLAMVGYATNPYANISSNRSSLLRHLDANGIISCDYVSCDSCRESVYCMETLFYMEGDIPLDTHKVTELEFCSDNGYTKDNGYCGKS
mmetsp:Transcript_18607/g.18698  ORF Transcript_18607/g.18698 Transcript_18607/m.18698 type:complete len:121 (+) Transcript_18607:149-511(+)